MVYHRGGSGIQKMVRPGSGCGHPVMRRFSECQYNMSFHVQKVPDISNGWSDIPSKKEA